MTIRRRDDAPVDGIEAGFEGRQGVGEHRLVRGVQAQHDPSAVVGQDNCAQVRIDVLIESEIETDWCRGQGCSGNRR
jgi:hypothetical protein